MDVKPDKKTDPIAWFEWFEAKRKAGVVRGNKTRDGRSESAHKAWATRRAKK